MSETNDTKPNASGNEQSSEHELLPNEILWAAGGHASDVAITALADGQRELLPHDVIVHVEHCPTCTTHLGHAALLSLHTGAELATRATHERAAARRPLPRLAIALGLAVATVGLLPSVLDGAGDISAVRSFATRDAPLFVQGLRTLAHRFEERGSGAGLFVTYAAATLLVVMAIFVVRVLPKAQKETSR